MKKTWFIIIVILAILLLFTIIYSYRYALHPYVQNILPADLVMISF